MCLQTHFKNELIYFPLFNSFFFCVQTYYRNDEIFLRKMKRQIDKKKSRQEKREVFRYFRPRIEKFDNDN